MAYDTSDPEGLGFGSYPGDEHFPADGAPLPQYELIAHAQSNINLLRAYQSARWTKNGPASELRQMFEQQLKRAANNPPTRLLSSSSGFSTASASTMRMDPSTSASYSGYGNSL